MGFGVGGFWAHTQHANPSNFVFGKSTAVQDIADIARQFHRRSPAIHQGRDIGEPRGWRACVEAFVGRYMYKNPINL